MPTPLAPGHVDVRPVADEEALPGRDAHLGQGALEDVGARLPPAHGVRHDHGLEAAEDAALREDAPDGRRVVEVRDDRRGGSDP